MHANNRSILIAFLVLTMSLLACDVSVPSLLKKPTPTPVPVVVGDDGQLVYSLPQYAIDLNINDSVPGTQIRYLGRVNDTYQISIDGLNAYKRGGDSLAWRGVMAPGVFADFDLHVDESSSAEVLSIRGPLTLTILDAKPIELNETPDLVAPIYYFGGVSTAYRAQAGQSLPGTSLIVTGINGNEVTFSGTDNYPKFKINDSLIWQGTLRDNVFVRYDLRIQSADTNGVLVTGSAELWIQPPK